MSSVLMTEPEALRIHLSGSEVTPILGYTYTSGFVAALRDARDGTGRDANTGAVTCEQKTGNWLGAVGYLILMDQIGKCFKPRNCLVADNGNSITRCLNHWTILPQNEIGAIYGLRNALAHDYSLFNRNSGSLILQHLYRLDRSVGHGVVRFGKTQWGGDYANISPDCTTTISLRELGELTERIVHKIREAFDHDELSISLSGGSDELLRRYGLLIPSNVAGPPYGTPLK